MRTCLSLLLLSALACQAEEVSNGVRDAFRRHDAALNSFRVLETRWMNANTTMVLAEASPVRYPFTMVGLFLVSAPFDHVRVIDMFPSNEMEGSPEFDGVDEHSARLQFRSEYGFYGGSIRYAFDLVDERPPVKTHYGFLAITAASKKNGELVYVGSFGHWNQGKLETKYASVTTRPPSYPIVVLPTQPAPPVQVSSSSAGGGQTLRVINQTPPGRERQPSFIELTDAHGRTQSFPVPVPTMEQRPGSPPAGSPRIMENDIGPFAFDGRTLWFANSFYDGEGFSGVGAIGAFDAVTHQYTMHYLPEMAPWSGSAILLDGDFIWIGLMRRPEGAKHGVGLIRCNKRADEVRNYPLGPHVINTIDRIGDTVYCGTTNGLYVVNGDRITHLRFEPDDAGKLTMVPRTVR